MAEPRKRLLGEASKHNRLKTPFSRGCRATTREDRLLRRAHLKCLTLHDSISELHFLLSEDSDAEESSDVEKTQWATYYLFDAIPLIYPIVHQACKVRELFTAGYVELCKAAGNVQPAQLRNLSASSYHLVAAQCGSELIEDLLDRIDFKDAPYLKDEFWMPKVEPLIASHLDDCINWANSFDFDFDLLAVQLEMELSQSLLVLDRLPAPPATKSRTTNGSVSNIKARRMPAPLCSKCKEQTKATASPVGFQYWKCSNCGETGKRPRPRQRPTDVT